MEDIKVIIYGVGGVGSGIVKALSTKAGVRLVGAIDPAPFKLGKDVGTVAGVNPLGIKIMGDPTTFINDQIKADVIIDTGSPVNGKDTFERMQWAIKNHINVLVACAETSNMWYTDPDTAKAVDTMCKEYDVSYLGIGALQVLERLIIALTEGNTEVERIESIHHADTTAFSPESKGAEYGITLTKEQYEQGCSDGSVKDKEELKDSIPYIGAHFGWKINKVTLEKEVFYDDKDTIYKFIGKVNGYEDGVLRLSMIDEMMDDPKHEYFDHIHIVGTSTVDCMINYTPDRGVVSTQAALVNAIPHIINMPSGYINSLTVPACSIILDDFRNHI